MSHYAVRRENTNCHHSIWTALCIWSWEKELQSNISHSARCHITRDTNHPWWHLTCPDKGSCVNPFEKLDISRNLLARVQHVWVKMVMNYPKLCQSPTCLSKFRLDCIWTIQTGESKDLKKKIQVPVQPKLSDKPAWGCSGTSITQQKIFSTNNPGSWPCCCFMLRIDSFLPLEIFMDLRQEGNYASILQNDVFNVFKHPDFNWFSLHAPKTNGLDSLRWSFGSFCNLDFCIFSPLRFPPVLIVT